MLMPMVGVSVPVGAVTVLLGLFVFAANVLLNVKVAASAR